MQRKIIVTMIMFCVFQLFVKSAAQLVWGTLFIHEKEGSAVWSVPEENKKCQLSNHRLRSVFLSSSSLYLFIIFFKLIIISLVYNLF